MKLLQKLAMILIVLGLIVSVRGATETWTGPGGLTTAPIGGIWDTTTANQWNNGTGTAGNAVWANGNAAVFGGVDGAYGIKIGAAGMSGTSLTFNNSGYALTNDAAQTVAFSATAGAITVASGKSATIGKNVTVTVTGNPGIFNAGAVNAGTLIVDNGGVLDQPNALGLHLDGAPGSTVQVKTGGLVSHTGNGSQFRVGLTANSSPLLDVEGGSVIIGAANPGLIIAAAANSTGTVSVVSGLVSVTNQPITIGGNATGANGIINLNGGLISAKQLTTTAGSTSTFNFNGGTLKTGNSGSTTVFMNGLTAANVRNNGAIIDYNGYDITIGQALAHSAIAGDAATDGGLVVTNSRVGGSLTLSNAMTYNGPTVVKTGAKLAITTRSIGGGSFTVADGATLEVQVPIAGQTLASSSLTLGASGSLTNNFTLGANASTTIPAVTVSGPLNLNGTVSVAVSAAGLTGPNTYLLMSYGSISGAGSFVPVSLPSVPGYLVSLNNDTAAKQLKLVYTLAPTPVKWAVGDGNWDTTSPNWNLLSGTGPTTYVEGALAAFDDTATGGSPITVTLTGMRSPNMVSNNAAKNYILAGSFGFTGTPVVKNGSGALIIDNSGPNAFSSIAVNSGTLQLGNNDAGGDLGSGIISNNAALTFNRTDNATVAAVIAGSGVVAQDGSGTVTLTGASTFTNITAINNGQLLLGNIAALQGSTVSNNLPNGLGFFGITAAMLGGLAGAGDITMLNEASSLVPLTVGGNNQTTIYSGSLSGGANLLKAGTNVLTLTGANLTLGSIQVTGAGTLVIQNANATLNNLQLLTDNATLVLSNANTTVTTDSRIAGANGVYNVNGGTLNLAKVVIGSAAAANTNNLVTVSGAAQVYQNQSGGGTLQQLWIGGNNSGSGALLLKDNASWNNGNASPFDGSGNPIVAVGNVGTGQGAFTIQDNATFYYNNIMRVAWAAGNVGTVNLNGGVCSVAGINKGSGAGTVNVNNGQIQALTATANFFGGFTNTSGANAVNLVSGKLTFDNNGNLVTISNVLSGAGGLAAQGGGILTLAGANTYTGNTIINSGTLKLVGAGTINSSSSVSNNSFTTLDMSTANAQLSVAGALTLNDSTLIMNLVSTNIIAGTFGTAGSANTINITVLPPVSSLPFTTRVIKYSTAAPGLVDGGNNLLALAATLPATSSPLGYLTNNQTAHAIDLVITNMALLPVAIGQPANDAAYAGYNAHFSVSLELTNSPGLAYHWRKAGTPLTDGGNIVGAATATLRITNVSALDVANYDVVVTNISGSITSSPASLALLVPTNFEAAAVSAGPAALYMLQDLADPSTGNAVAFDYAGDLDGLYGSAAFNGFSGTAGPRPSDGFLYMNETNLAAQFQGSVPNSHVAIPPLNLNTNTVTLATWIKPGSPASFAGIIFCRGSDTIAGLNFTGNFDVSGNRTLGYTWNNESGTYSWDSQIAPPNGIWSYVALVITPTNAAIYVFNNNGLLAAVHPYTHVNQSFSSATTIGDDTIAGGNREADATMDGVGIYAKSLSLGQLSAIYGAASGVSNFAPVIVTQPAGVTRYEHQTAAFSVGASGSDPMSYQWMSFDGVSIYTPLVNNSRISGATSPSLTISSLDLGDATNLVLVVTNALGAQTSSVVTLTVNPVLGPPTNFTTTVIQGAGLDWDTDGTWNIPGSATDLSGQYFGSTFAVVSNGGLRTPNFNNPATPTSATFPGDVLYVQGNGGFDSSFTVSGGIRVKGGNPATVYFKKLVMAGGQICNILNSGWPAILTGEVDVISNTVVWASDDTAPRSINIQSTLTGNGSITYQAYINFTTLQTSSGASLNISNANNTYTGTWNVPLGSLVGSAPNALGTNNITVGAEGALQTTYDIHSTNATLVLNGRMYLTQNDTFRNVSINGVNLQGGTYSFATLAANYPTNFPSTWTPLNGALSATSPAGSITVLASTIAAYPTNITANISGGLLSLSWPATHLGWIAQSNSVSLANSNFWFDIAGSESGTSLNVTPNPAITNVYYRLRHP